MPISKKNKKNRRSPSSKESGETQGFNQLSKQEREHWQMGGAPKIDKIYIYPIR